MSSANHAGAVTRFDYGALAAENIVTIHQRAAEIRTLVKRSGQDIIDIGTRLIEVKALVGYGNWSAWLDAEFGWTQMTATKFMNIARKFKGTLILPSDSIEVLALLAAPSTPEEIRVQVIERAQAGEVITHKEVIRMVSADKAEPFAAALQAVPTSIPIKSFQVATPIASMSVMAPISAPMAVPVQAVPDEDDTPEEEAQKQDTDEYYTPEYIIAAVRTVLGEIDLDPASCERAQAVVQAGSYYTKADDGLNRSWCGRVFLNPPYSSPQPFVLRMIDEYATGNVEAAIVLTNTGTETEWGQALLAQYPVCFFGYGGERGSRISFWTKNPDEAKKGNRYAQMIFYLGQESQKFGAVFSRFGTVWEKK